ncbi:MAG: hypothetical protein K8R90_07630 [Candidatus Cloacimonetes bacterium]|nr:hypothetical protein [Candidatus Cloacimonadota bacterium]
MSTFYQQLTAMILTPTIVVLVVAWLLRKFIDQGFKRELEQFRIRLESESSQHLMRFSLIHQKRAEVITELYKRLASSKMMLIDLVHPLQFGGQNLDEKKQKTAKTYDQFFIYFQENRILCSAPLVKTILLAE